MPIKDGLRNVQDVIEKRQMGESTRRETAKTVQELLQKLQALKKLIDSKSVDQLASVRRPPLRCPAAPLPRCLCPLARVLGSLLPFHSHIHAHHTATPAHNPPPTPPAARLDIRYTHQAQSNLAWIEDQTRSLPAGGEWQRNIMQVVKRYKKDIARILAESV